MYFIPYVCSNLTRSHGTLTFFLQFSNDFIFALLSNFHRSHNETFNIQRHPQRLFVVTTFSFSFFFYFSKSYNHYNNMRCLHTKRADGERDNIVKISDNNIFVGHCIRVRVKKWLADRVNKKKKIKTYKKKPIHTFQYTLLSPFYYPKYLLYTRL